MTPRLLPASHLKGSNVKNIEGQNIGKVEDIMIDWAQGSVAYAVLSFGGFLGMGQKFFAIPLEAFNFQTEDKTTHLVLDIDKESLENAPGFDRDHWPQNPDRTFISAVYSHYGHEPYWSRYGHQIM